MPLKYGKSSQENKWGHPEKSVQISRKTCKIRVKLGVVGFDLKTSGLPDQGLTAVLWLPLHLFSQNMEDWLL